MAIAPQISVSVTPSIGTTTDGTSTVTLLSVPFHDGYGAQAITFDVTGYDFTNEDVATAKIHVKAKNVNGTLSMIGTPVHIVPIIAGSSTALQSATVTAVVSGSNINLNVIGVTGKTIKWVAYANPGIEVLNTWTAVPTPGDGYVNIWSGSNTRWEPTAISSAVSGATIAGDVTGTIVASTVSKLQGRTLASTAPQDGYVITWNSGNNRWEPSANGALVPLVGDVSGNVDNNTVDKINGATVPVSGSLTTGNILQVNGASSLTYGPINLAGGANYVTGSLPTANQVAQIMGGDVSGTTAAATVAKIQGNAVASQSLGASQDGYGLTWSNSDGYWKASQIANGAAGGDLSGTYPNPTVAKIKGNAVASQSLGASQDGYALTWSNSDGYWKASQVANGAAGGDLSGTYPNPTVVRAEGLKTNSTTVVVSSASAPSAGQVLTASSSTAASWATPTTSIGAVSAVFGYINIDTSWTLPAVSNTEKVITGVDGYNGSSIIETYFTDGYFKVISDGYYTLSFTLNASVDSAPHNFSTAVFVNGSQASGSFKDYVAGNVYKSFTYNYTKYLSGNDTIDVRTVTPVSSSAYTFTINAGQIMLTRL